MLVLDSWAMLAFLNAEPAAAKVKAALLDGSAAASSINLGDVLYMRSRMIGQGQAEGEVDQFRRHLKVIDPDWPMVKAAAWVKAGGGLSYADSFCIAAALELSVPLWTGDPEILDLASRYGYEVLDLRSPEADSNR